MEALASNPNIWKQGQALYVSLRNDSSTKEVPSQPELHGYMRHAHAVYKQKERD